jgi:hypothetical protein
VPPLFGVPAALLGGALVDCVGRRKGLALGSLLMVLGWLMVFATPLPDAAARAALAADALQPQLCPGRARAGGYAPFAFYFHSESVFDGAVENMGATGVSPRKTGVVRPGAVTVTALLLFGGRILNYIALNIQVAAGLGSVVALRRCSTVVHHWICDQSQWRSF